MPNFLRNGEFLIDFLQKLATAINSNLRTYKETCTLLHAPPVLRMVSGNGFFRLESDTSRTAAGATLYQWQNNEWVLVGCHSK